MWFDAQAALAELAGGDMPPVDPPARQSAPKERAETLKHRVAHVAHVARPPAPETEKAGVRAEEHSAPLTVAKANGLANAILDEIGAAPTAREAKAVAERHKADLDRIEAVVPVRIIHVQNLVRVQFPAKPD